MGEQETTEKVLNKDEYDSQVFDCPKCGTHLQFGLRINIRRVKIADTPPAGWSRSLDTLTTTERAVVEECRVAGLFDAYLAAFAASKLEGKPSDPEKFFINWLMHAAKKKTPQFAIRLCLPEGERGGSLELWTHGLISAVLVNGEFRQFIPTELVRGDKTSNLTLNGGWIQTGEKIDVERWVRTRNGYVVGRGLMFNALKRKAAGSFDTVGL